MPKTQRTPPVNSEPARLTEVAVDLTNLTYDDLDPAARGWQVPPGARFVVHRGEVSRLDQVHLTWPIPAVPLPEPKVKLACVLSVGDKIRHPDSGEWLVVLRYGDPSPDPFSPSFNAPAATGLVRWQALNNRLQTVVLQFLAAHEVPVYEEIR